jgi:peptidoglycan/xylan/chitin deacetylase (PgdA/CDA1 family)
MSACRRISLWIAIAGVCAFSVAVFVGDRFVLPVLMYHSLAEMPAGKKNSLVVSAAAFEKQMRMLRQWKYSVLTLEQAAQQLRGRGPAYRPVAVTFDDGYEDNYTLAFPVLKKYRIPATIFLIYSKIGTPGYLNWDQIGEMKASGLIAFGSHTVTHRVLTLIPVEELEQEIAGSRRLLEEKLGQVKLFSYPVGKYNPEVRAAVIAAGYDAAVSTNPRYRGNDNYALKRIKIAENAQNPLVFIVETSGYYTLLRDLRQSRKKTE